MKMPINIVGYVGAGPVLFGMTEAQVENLLGPPLSAYPAIPESGKSAHYESFTVHYSYDHKVMEIGFSDDAKVIFDGIDIFGDPAAFRKLILKDGSPYEDYGFIVLLNLGITLGGMHDGNIEQRGATAFARGTWDRFKKNFKKFPVNDQ